MLEPLDPFAPYRSPKAATPDHPRFVEWEEAQPVFANIYDACARSLALIDAAYGIPSPLQFRVWSRFDRCCH